MVHHYCFVHLKISRGRKCCNGPLQELAGSRSKLQPQTPQHSREVGAKSSENGQTSLPSQRKREKEKGEIITQWKITSEMGWWCRMGGELARGNHSLGSPRNLFCKITQNVSLDIFQVNSSESMLFLCKENPKDCYLMASHYRSFLFINYYSSVIFDVVLISFRSQMYGVIPGSRKKHGVEENIL